MLIHRVVWDAATFRLDETAEGRAGGVDGHAEMLRSPIDFGFQNSSIVHTPGSRPLGIPTQGPRVSSCV